MRDLSTRDEALVSMDVRWQNGDSTHTGARRTGLDRLAMRDASLQINLQGYQVSQEVISFTCIYAPERMAFR